jgi:hypothetical protein
MWCYVDFLSGDVMAERWECVWCTREVTMLIIEQWQHSLPSRPAQCHHLQIFILREKFMLFSEKKTFLTV